LNPNFLRSRPNIDVLRDHPYYRDKWASLSELVKDLKQNFTRFYNRRHNKKGFFWGDRFKSMIVENGETLINCLAYIDLKPVPAGMVSAPDDYRWNTLGYLLQTGNLLLLFCLKNEQS
jgi:hypothetical protein